MILEIRSQRIDRPDRSRLEAALASLERVPCETISLSEPATDRMMVVYFVSKIGYRVTYIDSDAVDVVLIDPQHDLDPVQDPLLGEAPRCAYVDFGEALRALSEFLVTGAEPEGEWHFAGTLDEIGEFDE